VPRTTSEVQKDGSESHHDYRTAEREVKHANSPNYSRHSDFTTLDRATTERGTQMRIAGMVLGALLVSVLAGIVLLAYRSSQETQKGLAASFADVPTEANKVYVGALARATEVAHMARETTNKQDPAAEAGYAEVTE
jgi:hypothetical protein